MPKNLVRIIRGRRMGFEEGGPSTYPGKSHLVKGAGMNLKMDGSPISVFAYDFGLIPSLMNSDCYSAADQ